MIFVSARPTVACNDMNPVASLARRPTLLAIAAALLILVISARGRRASAAPSSKVGAAAWAPESDLAHTVAMHTAPPDGERRFDGACSFFGVFAILRLERHGITSDRGRSPKIRTTIVVGATAPATTGGGITETLLRGVASGRKEESIGRWEREKGGVPGRPRGLSL